MSDIDLLNESLAGEHFAIAAYDAALGSGLLDEPTADVARAFQSDHKRHRELLAEQIAARGSTPVAALGSDDYAKSFPPLTTAAEIIAYATHSRPARLGRASPASPTTRTGPSPSSPPRSEASKRSTGRSSSPPPEPTLCPRRSSTSTARRTRGLGVAHVSGSA